jgi:hypothetical protein
VTAYDVESGRRTAWNLIGFYPVVGGVECALSFANPFSGLSSDRIAAVIHFLKLPATRIPRANSTSARVLIPAAIITTLAYAWMVNTGQPTTGVNLLILIIAVVIDLGGIGGEYHRRSRWVD